MKIENGKLVELQYILRVDGPQGEIAEQTEEDEPLRFVLGEDPMLPKFEEALLGLSAGDTFQISIPCDDAYGPESDEHYVEFPKSEFVDEDGELDEEIFQVGEVIPMNTPEGDVVYGILDEVKLNSIVIDFNHPMAGENLYFEGVITAVSEPTQ